MNEGVKINVLWVFNVMIKIISVWVLLWGTDYNRTSLRMTKKDSEYTDEDKEAGMKVSAF